MRYNLCVGLVLGVLVGLGSRTGASPGADTLQPVPVKQVKFDDRFWASKLKVYKERTIPHSWNYMGWNLRALRTAAGEKVKGDLNGTWDEANLHKFLETIAHALGVFPDAALEQRADEVIALLARVQRSDGYAHVYVLNAKKTPWDPVFQVEHRPDWLGGVSVIKGAKADGQPFLAIPFYALANRAKSSQEVWAAQRDFKPDPHWWLGELYRPYRPAPPAPRK
jgi:DUF1680 family protein